MMRNMFPLCLKCMFSWHAKSFYYPHAPLPSKKYSSCNADAGRGKIFAHFFSGVLLHIAVRLRFDDPSPESTVDAKHASRCSLRGGRARIVEKPLVFFIKFSHDLNSYQKKGVPNHLPQTASPRGVLLVGVRVLLVTFSL